MRRIAILILTAALCSCAAIGTGPEPGEQSFPVLAVTSMLSQAAFLSLVTPSGRSTPPWHFDDIDAAIAYGIRKANEWLDL